MVENCITSDRSYKKLSCLLHGRIAWALLVGTALLSASCASWAADGKGSGAPTPKQKIAKRESCAPANNLPGKTSAGTTVDKPEPRVRSESTPSVPPSDKRLTLQSRLENKRDVENNSLQCAKDKSISDDENIECEKSQSASSAEQCEQSSEHQQDLVLPAPSQRVPED